MEKFSLIRFYFQTYDSFEPFSWTAIFLSFVFSPLESDFWAHLKGRKGRNAGYCGDNQLMKNPYVGVQI